MKEVDDTSARLHRVRGSIDALNRRCAQSSQELEAVVSLRRSAPSSDAGWPIELVCAVTLLALAAESVALWLLSEPGSALKPTARGATVALLASCGVGLSALAGEAMHRGRVDRAYRAKRVMWLVGAGTAMLLALTVRWGWRFAGVYAGGSNSRGVELDGVVIGAVALVLLLAPGIAFAHRERWSMMAARRRSRRLQRTLRADERRRDKRYDEWVTLRSQLRVLPGSVRYDSAGDTPAAIRPGVGGTASP